MQDKTLRMRAVEGLPADFNCARDGAFCSWTLLPKRPELMVIEDTMQDPRCTFGSHRKLKMETFKASNPEGVDVCKLLSVTDSLICPGFRRWTTSRDPTACASMLEPRCWLQMGRAWGLCKLPPCFKA